MSAEAETTEGAGLFIAEELPKFYTRYGWTDTVPSSSREHHMQVGTNEAIMLSRRGPNDGIGRRAAEIMLIREIVQTGSTTITDFQKVKKLKAELADEYSAIFSPDAAQHIAIDYLNQLDASLERIHISKKIARAAGYIAARSNLYVITKLDTLEHGDTRVTAAKLIGLAQKAADKIPRHVLPVVGGRNNKPSLLKDTRRLNGRTVRPNVLDVFEAMPTTWK